MSQVLNFLERVFSRFQLEDLFLNLILTLLILVITKVVLKLANSFIDKLIISKKLKDRLDDRRINTAATLLKSLLRYLIYFVSLVTILQLFKVPVGSVLTTAGIAGVALAFGAQNLIRDLLNGFFILFEDQYGVGDQISISDITGMVEEIGLRTTKVRDVGGQLHIIPNGKIDRVTNHMGPAMLAQIDIPVCYTVGLERIFTLLEGILRDFNQSHSDLVEPARLLGIYALTENGMVIRILARTKPQAQWGVERELRLLVSQVFDQLEISLTSQGN